MVMRYIGSRADFLTCSVTSVRLISLRSSVPLDAGEVCSQLLRHLGARDDLPELEGGVVGDAHHVPRKLRVEAGHRPELVRDAVGEGARDREAGRAVEQHQLAVQLATGLEARDGVTHDLVVLGRVGEADPEQGRGVGVQADGHGLDLVAGHRSLRNFSWRTSDVFSRNRSAHVLQGKVVLVRESQYFIVEELTNLVRICFLLAHHF